MFYFFVSFFVSLLLGKFFLIFFQKYKLYQPIRQINVAHLNKKTPTMGGIFLILSALLSFFSFSNLNTKEVKLILLNGISHFILGFWDDYLKIKEKNNKGVSNKTKSYWSLFTFLLLLFFDPNMNGLDFFYSYMFTNAVNFTDGLDGLAGGCICISYLGYILILIQEYPEICLLNTCIIGSTLGFLFYNRFPAQIFMGDVGALAIGAMYGMMAIQTKTRLFSLLNGGIFVIEFLSSIIQIYFFHVHKMRFFKMAPLHHHFELSGMVQKTITNRFLILNMFFSYVAIMIFIIIK